MMKRLFVAASAAPLCFAAGAVWAQTEITTNTTTPLATSSTGNLIVDTNGGVTVRTGGAAITVDSNNSVLNQGTISVRDSTTGGTGILVLTDSGVPHVNGMTIAGALAADETTAEVDADKDGDPDGAFVAPGMIRYGIRVTGNQTMTGTIFVNEAGIISVEGVDKSAAISVEAPLSGSIIVSGQLGARGNDSYGLRTTSGINGNIDVFGTVSVQGANGSAISLEGPIAGRLMIQGSVTNSGFRYLSRSAAPNGIDKLDADDLLIGGPAIRIANTLTGGLTVDAPPPVTDVTDANGDGVPDDTDQDDDGLVDAAEKTGTVNNFGSAPAVLIGSTSGLTLGNAGAGRDAFGVVIHGSVNSTGVYEGISSKGMQIGGLGGAVDTSNGVSVTGSLTSSAFSADTTALHLASGAVVPTISVDSGKISAGADTVEGTVVNTRGILIDAGATVTTIDNAGTIQAGVNGPAGNATAILDNSGTVSTVNNRANILANVKPLTEDGTAVGDAIALDLRANTTGVTLNQTPRSGTETAPSIGGDVLFSAGNFNDTVNVTSGVIDGRIAFGGGADALNINGDGAVVRGGLEKGSGTLQVGITNGTLDLDKTGATNVSNLVASADSVISFTADPTQTSPSLRASTLNVAGVAAFDTGAQVKVKFLNKLTGTQSFTVLTAGSLIDGGIIADLSGQVPALFNGHMTVGSNSITVEASRRSATDLGLAGGRAQAFEAFYTAFDADSDVATQFLGKTTDADFRKLYQQFLPDYSGGPFKTLTDTVREGLAAQAHTPVGLQPGEPRSWLQEVGLTVKQETVDDVPYQTGGFGLIGGYERPTRGGGYVGLSGSYMSSEIRNSIRVLGSHLAASAVTGGAYWRQPMNDVMIDAELGGGFAWFDSTRRIVDSNAAGQQLLVRQADGSWNGVLGAARVGAAYSLDLGPVYVRPRANINAVYLREGSYTERGGGPAVNLSVESRSNYEAAAEIGVTIGSEFGRTYHWAPELMIGYRSILASGDGSTSASFASVAGSDFTLTGLQREKGLLILRAALRGRGAYSNLAFEAGGEIGEDYSAYSATFSVRFAF